IAACSFSLHDALPSSTRVRLLQQWCDNQWATLQGMTRALSVDPAGVAGAQLRQLMAKMPDATELMLLDRKGTLIGSSSDHGGELDRKSTRLNSSHVKI